MIRVLSARIASASAIWVRMGFSSRWRRTVYAHMVKPWASRTGCSAAIRARPSGTTMAARSGREGLPGVAVAAVAAVFSAMATKIPVGEMAVDN